MSNLREKFPSIYIEEQLLKDQTQTDISLILNEKETTSLNKTIEFEVKTKIMELEQVIKDVKRKNKYLEKNKSVNKAIQLLTPLLKSKNKAAVHRLLEVINILKNLS